MNIADNFTKRLASCGLCGELGALQTTAWQSLDAGVGYQAWLVAIGTVQPVHLNTARKQYRLAEADRNACLVDDGMPSLQTRYGVRAS